MSEIGKVINGLGLLIMLGAFLTALWSMRNIFRGHAEIHAAYQKQFTARKIRSQPPAITMIGHVEALKLFGVNWDKIEPVRAHVYAQRTIIKCMVIFIGTLMTLTVLGLLDIVPMTFEQRNLSK